MSINALEPLRVRQPVGAWGWTDLRIVTEDHLIDLTTKAGYTYLFLCAVGNRHGVSFWPVARIAAILGFPDEEISEALAELQEHNLIAREGKVVQVLPVPDRVCTRNRIVPTKTQEPPTSPAVRPAPSPVIDEKTVRKFQSRARKQLGELGGLHHKHPASVVRALAKSLALQAGQQTASPSQDSKEVKPRE